MNFHTVIMSKSPITIHINQNYRIQLSLRKVWLCLFVPKIYMGQFEQKIITKWPSFQEPPKLRHKVSITPQHLDDPTKMLPEFEEPAILPIEFHHRNRVDSTFKGEPRPTITTTEMPLKARQLPKLWLTCKHEDVLQSKRGGIM